MGLLEIILTAIGLSMDAFAVSICKGLSTKDVRLKHSLIVGLYFGLFQALMPVAGYFLGYNFQEAISAIDHWIAFILLGFLGVKMIADSIKPWYKKRRAIKRGEEYEEETPAADAPVKLGVKTLLVMSVATSIDALAVGVTFGLLESTNIWIAIGIIGAITLVLCLIGVVIGIKVGAKFQHKAEFLGGLVLIALGLKILIEHLIA